MNLLSACIFCVLLSRVVSFSIIHTNIDRNIRFDVPSNSHNLVALTREKGTNQKLRSILLDINCVEIPCLQFSILGVEDHLRKEILSSDIIVLSSPQAAKIFINIWKSLDKPTVKIVALGVGTSKPLIAENLFPLFQPTEATADCLAATCPTEHGLKVLYPTSQLADNTLVSGLSRRGFKVTRLNSYTTISAIWTPEQLSLAKQCNVVAFASPSAVRTWVEKVGCDSVAVTIGPTTEQAARASGFHKVYSPKEGSKGLEPWAALIREVVHGHEQ